MVATTLESEAVQTEEALTTTANSNLTVIAISILAASQRNIELAQSHSLAPKIERALGQNIWELILATTASS